MPFLISEYKDLVILSQRKYTFLEINSLDCYILSILDFKEI